MKTKLSRDIDPAHYKRANSVPSSEVGSYMDSIAVSLHQSLDAWRYHNGSIDDVTLCVDALVALWTSIENRQPNVD